MLEESRKNILDLDSRAVSIRSAVDEVYQDADTRRREIFARSEEQAKSLDAGIKEAERHIREFFEQTKLIDQANTYKAEVERKIEDLRGDMDRLEQRRTEAAQMENEFAKIRRMEDDVISKMTRLASEKYRIDKMDSDFNKLLLISKSVEEKLAEVTTSDDVLKDIQARIRRFNDALTAADEKFHRIEKKDSVLEATAEGIDRDFKALNELDRTIKKAGEDINRLISEKNELGESINVLAEQNVKANEAAEIVSKLDTSLSEINGKIKDVQTARDWIARAEKRLDDINKQTQNYFKLTETILGDKKEKDSIGPGAPTLNKKENVILLARRGWPKEAIASTMKISLGEVELILETFDKA